MAKITAAVASVSALLLASTASAYNIYNTSIVNCRAGPSTATDLVRTYTMGSDIEITCQVEGQKLFGTKIWDKTQDGCYILDYYVYTGYSQIFKPVCGSESDTSSSDKPTASASAPAASKSDEDATADVGSDAKSASEDGADATGDSKAEESAELPSSDDKDENSSNDDSNNGTDVGGLDSQSEPESEDGSESDDNSESNKSDDEETTSNASHAASSLFSSVLAVGAASCYALSLF
ncbi:hypothetical protein LPJ72_005979 [Coemansia sp. Benny D160-2]|nr:hypothetical protein LPJ72_005979 [Coemansia sp. Benny D160-2]